MPVKQCTLEGQPGFKWGDAGKCYTYDPANPESEAAARASATRQGQAAYAGGYQGKESDTEKTHNGGVKKMELINQEVLLNKHIIRVEDTPDGILVLYSREREDIDKGEGLDGGPAVEGYGSALDGKGYGMCPKCLCKALNKEGWCMKCAKQVAEPLAKGEEVELDIQFPIAKAEERLVTGVVLEPNVVDAHSDFESAATIKDAAHGFLRKYNRQSMLGLGHRLFGAIGVDLVESYIAPQDMSLGGETVRKGSWLMTVKIHDDSIWNMVKSGEITGFSIGGRARVRPAKPPAK